MIAIAPHRQRTRMRFPAHVLPFRRVGVTLAVDAIFRLHKHFMVQGGKQRQQLVDFDRAGVELHDRDTALANAQALRQLRLR